MYSTDSVFHNKQATLHLHTYHTYTQHHLQASASGRCMQSGTSSRSSHTATTGLSDSAAGLSWEAPPCRIRHSFDWHHLDGSAPVRHGSCAISGLPLATHDLEWSLAYGWRMTACFGNGLKSNLLNRWKGRYRMSSGS